MFNVELSIAPRRMLLMALDVQLKVPPVTFSVAGPPKPSTTPDVAAIEPPEIVTFAVVVEPKLPTSR